MTYDDDQRSTQDGRPIDLYTVTAGVTTHRFTSYHRDVTLGGFTYSALTVSRGQMPIAPKSEGRELTVYIPVSHPLAQRYLQVGVPPYEVKLTAQRLQQRSGTAQQFWSGYVNAISVEDNLAMLVSPSLNDTARKINLPVFSARTTCNHILYDTQCQKPRAAFKVSTTITNISGSTVTVAGVGGHADQFFQFGEIVHTASSERRTLVAQVSLALTLQIPIIEAVIGDAVDLFAGCDHSVETCRDKFGNVDNFGGQPEMSKVRHYWDLFGLGVRQ